MPSLSTRLTLLRRLPPPLRASALVAALPHAGPHERDDLLADALDAAGPAPGPVYGAALRLWPHLSAPARVALVGAMGSALPAQIREWRAECGGADRPALISFVVSAWAVLLTGSAAGGLPLDRRDVGLRLELDEALAMLAASYQEHRSPEVLDVIARLAHAPGPALRAWLRDQDQAGHMPLRAAARSLPPEVVRSRLVAWLGAPPLSAMARDRLREPSDEERLAAMEQSHLLLVPRRMTAAARIMPSGALLAPTEEGEPKESARRGRVRWARLLPLRPDERVEALAPALADSSPMVRLGAVQALGAVAANPATDALVSDFAFDEHAAVASAAAAELALAGSVSRRRSAAPVLSALRRSPHEAVRRIAGPALALAGEWEASIEEEGSAAAPALAARRLLSARPEEFIERWRGAWSGAEGALRLRLLDLVGRLGVGARVASELCAAAADGEARVASKAVLLLGGVRTADALEAVRTALQSTDGRVRANAVEALSKIEPREARLEVFIDDAVARVRANALRTLARPGDGSGGGPVRGVAEMLSDEREGHRLSGLWLAARLRRIELLPRVVELAGAGSAPAVRERARRCAAQLRATTRHGWALAAGGPTITTRPLPMAGRSKESAS